jgi:hypothetical protein
VPWILPTSSEGGLDHRHHDQTRRQEVRERRAKHRAAGAAQGNGEDHQKQQGGDGGRPDRLELDLEETAHLLQIEGLQAAPIDLPDDRHARVGPHPIGRLIAHRAVARDRRREPQAGSSKEE